MAKLPWMQFYPSDWLLDTQLLSLETRGAWIDILCHMWREKDRGKLVLPVSDLAVLLHCDQGSVTAILCELETRKICTVTFRNDVVTLISRRIARDEKLRNNNKERQRKHRSHAPVTPVRHAPVTGIYQNQSHISESESESEVIKEKKEKKKRIKICDVPSAAATVWGRYSEAYQARYKAEPVRNAKVNGQIAQLVKRIGGEAASEVAAFYVWHHDAYYVRSRHPLGLLLRDCEGLHTQWVTGQSVTQSQARKVDETAGRLNVFQELINERKGEVVDGKTS